MAAVVAAAGGARAQTPGPAPGSIPAIFRNSLVFVRAGVQGGPEGLFLVDTGAGETVLDAGFARRTHVRLGDALTINGVGGAVQGRRGLDVRLRIGALSGRLDPMVADLSRTAQAMGQPLAGVLGDDFLGRYVVRFDYRGQSFALTSPDLSPPPTDATALHMARTPYVTAVVRDGTRVARAEFQIDTGSNTALELWRPFARAAFPSAQGAPAQEQGLGGETAPRLSRLDALEVAGRRIAGPVANLADELRPDDAGADYGGVIGAPAWSGMTLTLDLPHQRLWLR